MEHLKVYSSEALVNNVKKILSKNKNNKTLNNLLPYTNDMLMMNEETDKVERILYKPTKITMRPMVERRPTTCSPISFNFQKYYKQPEIILEQDKDKKSERSLYI